MPCINLISKITCFCLVLIIITFFIAYFMVNICFTQESCKSIVIKVIKTIIEHRQVQNFYNKHMQEEDQ